MLPAIIPVDEGTRVAEVRRRAMASAREEGLTEEATQQTGIIATEMATNLVKHAKAGMVQISRLSASGEAGIELLSIDRGPGMANVQACIADGFSTAGTPGTGLGAISRLADVFDAYSQVGRGTVIVARKFAATRARTEKQGWTFSAVTVPYPGEEACGDSWAIRTNGASSFIIVADGLGHGLLAADASGAAMQAFYKAPLESPVSTLERVHQALRSTRGAAVAVSSIEEGSGRVRHAGLGNIASVLLGEGRTRQMVSHNGTAGLEARRFQEFAYPLPADPTLIMHSDGLTTSWSLDSYPGLLRRHPAIIAGILYRDASRGRDDACVVVGRQFTQ